MKKRMLPLLALTGAVLVSAPLLQGCYGNFSLTKKVYKWNGSLGNKWINSIVMIALNIVPVYGVAGFADAVILNLVEFWTGSNPLAMQPGEKEIRTVTVDGKSFLLTATQNKMEVTALDATAKTMDLTYDPATKSWFVESQEGRKLVARESEEVVTLYHADGHRELVARQ
jgi:hypothetical protein